MKASYAYGTSFFSIAFLLGLWFIFPFFSFFWLLFFIAIASTPTVVYVYGDRETAKQQLKRKDLEAVALAF